MPFNTLPQRVARCEQPEPVIKLWLRIAVALTAAILVFLVLYSFVASLDVPLIPKRVGLSGWPATALAERTAPHPPRQTPKLCEASARAKDPVQSKGRV